MSWALYDPDVGYYSRPRSPLGERGDYYTSPELHPAFAALIGRLVEQVWAVLGRPNSFVLHESGPGTGRFARDLLDSLQRYQPELYTVFSYHLDERSPALRLEQQRLLTRAGHLDRVRWVEGFESGEAPNFLFANELLDAFPVHLVERRADSLLELYVTLEDDRLALVPGPLSAPELAAYFQRLGTWPGEGCRAEVNLAALEWLRWAAAAVERGLVLLLDYGYPAELLYSPSRRSGTLLCYYQHTLNSNPLRHIGEQDITAHVDFTSLQRAGEAGGLEPLGLVSQRRLLGNLGWSRLRGMVESTPLPPTERAANLRALDSLIDPQGLGRVLSLAMQRGLEDFAPLGLLGGPAPNWSAPPLRQPDHLHLPDSAEAEGLLDIEAQWAELWGEHDEGATEN
jgi:SAM-dependent MidA family methyltransferase